MGIGNEKKKKIPDVAKNKFFFNFREIVKLLLEYDASPNIVDSKGSSPLHLAAWSGNVDIVRLLLTGPAICNVNLLVSRKPVSVME